MNMNEQYCRLEKKAKQILVSNVYEPNQYLWGSWRMMSPCKNHFEGIWNWDSAFHAVGMLYIDEELAKEQILGFLQFQKEDGLLPDVIFEDGRIEGRYTKPPVMAACAWRVYEQTKDADFIRSVYPAFVKNENFWATQRYDDGLFYFDSSWEGCKTETDHRTLVGWESGMDDSPRWDVSPENYWAIDANCYMVTMYQALANMATLLGEDGSCWSEKEKTLIENIEARLWDAEHQVYVDRNRKTGAFSDVYTPCSFLPLYVGFAPKDRAEAMHRIALKHFMPGMPTVAYDHPTYCDTYWRGLCWLNVAYFAAKGLKDYGYADTANTIRDTILGWVDQDGDLIHENYESLNGDPRGAPRFCWSCTFVLEFIHNF